MKKKLIIALVTSITTVVICLATGIGLWLGFGIKSADAVILDNEYSTLFMENGDINHALAGKLLDLAAAASTSTNALSVFNDSNARQIASANGTTNAPIIRLFEPLGTFTTDTSQLPTNDATSDKTAINFSNLRYRLVYITDTKHANPIFTFYATGAYRFVTFSDSGSSNNYNSQIVNGGLNTYSNAANALYSDYLRLRNGHYTSLLQGTYLVEYPSVVSWQGRQTNTWSNTDGRHNLTGDLYSYAKFWLPSGQEVGDSQTTNNTNGINNLFGLNAAEKAMSGAGFGSTSWLRSAHSGSTTAVRAITSSGGFSQSAASSALAIRPAIHMTFGYLLPKVPQITTQPVGKTVNVGTTTTLTCAASGNGTMTYNWYKSGDPTSVGSGALYTVPTTTAGSSNYYCVAKNTSVGRSKTTQSSTVTVTVQTPPNTPTITTQPVAKTVNVGGTATLTVAATGNGTLSYQWRTSAGTNVGTNSASYSAPTATAGSTSYYCIVTNTLSGQTATKTSSTVAVIVKPPPPTITTQPVAKTVNVGGTATLTVAATGTGTLSYQWRTSGGTNVGTNSASYSAPTTTAGSTSYYCIVTVTSGGQSNTTQSSTVAVVVKPTPPVITTQPVSSSAYVGDPSVVLKCVASGTVTYAWYKDGVYMAAGSTHTVTTTVVNSNSYYCIVTVTSSGQTNTTKSNTVTVNIQTPPNLPAITTQPISKTVFPGTAVTLTCSATGNGVLSYKWYKNDGTNVGSGTSYSPNTSAVGSIGYYCIVTNTLNGKSVTKTSNTATITVQQEPSIPNITTQPVGKTVNVGTAVTLICVGTGNGTITYAWYKTGTSTAVSTGGSYPVSTTTAGSSNYYCIVTNTLNGQSKTTQSNTVTVLVQIPPTAPTITTQPVAKTVIIGEVATLAIAATGNGTLSYTWYKTGTSTAVGTGSIYNAPTTTAGSVSYYCRVTNTLSGQTATKDSSAVAVNVKPLPPTITKQPVSSTVYVGDSSVVLSCTATGSGTITYAWYKNGALVGSTCAVTTAAVASDNYYCVTTVTSGGQSNTATSNTVTVNVVTPPNEPTITTHPFGAIVNMGQTAVVLTCSATGNGTLTYAWYRSGISVGTGSSYTIETTSPSSYSYYCIVTNTLNSKSVTKTSNTVTVTVRVNAGEPNITENPSSQTLNIGESINELSVTATSPDYGILSYQWFADTDEIAGDGFPITGAISNTYTPVILTGIGEYNYYCVIKNIKNDTTASTTTACATITIRPIASTDDIKFPDNPDDPDDEAGHIKITNLEGAEIYKNDDVDLSIYATVEDGTLSYEWYRNATNSTNGGTLVYSGSAKYENIETGTVGHFYYYVKVIQHLNDTTASKISNVALVTVHGTITIFPPPDRPDVDIEITKLNGETVYVGDPVDLSIKATVEDADGELSYEWYSNTVNSNIGGTQISGQTSSAYNRIDTNTVGTYYYYVKVILTLNETTAYKLSNVAEIIVNETPVDDPDIDDPDGSEGPAKPGDIKVTNLYTGDIYVGDEVTLSVTATITDDGELSYQWFKSTIESTDLGEVVGTNSNSLRIATNIAGTYYYYVKVTNTLNGFTKTTTSNIALIVINDLRTAQTPLIVTEPIDRDIDGKNFAISVTANVTDGGTLTYQWYEATSFDGSGIALTNQTSWELTLSKERNGTYYYYVIVTNTIMNERGRESETAKKSRVATIALDIIVSPPPENVRISEERTVSVGANITVWVNATLPAENGGTLKYKWYKNNSNSNTDGTLIPGAESREYTFNASSSGIWYYYAIVFNDVSGMEAGKATSETVKVTVNPLIEFDQDLSTETIVISQFKGTHSFSVTMKTNSEVDYSYQWQVSTDNEIWLNATGAVYSFWDYASVDYGFYYIRVQVTGTSTNNPEAKSVINSHTAVVQVNEIRALTPIIWLQPLSVEVNIGEDIVLSVAAESRDKGYISYQWYVSDTENGDYTAIHDSNSDIYQPKLEAGTTKYYYVMVINTVLPHLVHTETRAETQSAKVYARVRPIVVIAPEKPKVTIIGEAFVRIDEGFTTPIVLTVNADVAGYGNLTYQWYKCEAEMKNPVAITGANDKTYTITDTNPDKYYYYVEVINTDPNDSTNISKTNSALYTIEIRKVNPNNANLTMYIVLSILATLIVAGVSVAVVLVVRKRKKNRLAVD